MKRFDKDEFILFMGKTFRIIKLREHRFNIIWHITLPNIRMTKVPNSQERRLGIEWLWGKDDERYKYVYMLVWDKK